jgi:hypothetical protein
MIRLLVTGCLLAAAPSFAQSSGVDQDGKNLTLQQRYAAMKTKAETYQDYKVVKEYVLDGVWKIAMDSAKGQKIAIAQGRQTITRLEADLRAAQLTLKNEREAAADVVHKSTHISLLGMDFSKSVFLITMILMFGLLFFIGSAMVTRMKLMQVAVKEKKAIAELITREFEEFKRKAMEKQIKLARELQNERNKLAELKLR